MRLNGWQRLWVVLSCVWLAFALVQFAKSVPGEETAKRNAEAKATAELRAPDKQKSLDCLLERGPLPSYDDYVACDVKARDLSPAEQVALRQRIVALLPEAKADLRSAQLEMLGFYLLIWFVIVLLMYAMGWIAAWVVRGFRHKAA